MSAECRCGRPTRDVAYVCETCLDELNKALGDVPWLDEETEVTLTGQRGVDYRNKGGARSTTHPLPVNLGASAARGHLRHALVTWVRFCDEEGVRNSSPREGFPDDTLRAMSGWLMWRVDGLAFHELGSDAVDEITSAVAHCRRIIDSQAEKWYAGPCDGCGADLYAKAQTGSVVCSCGLTYDTEARRVWLLAAAEDRLADALMLSRAVSWLGASPLKADRVRKWAERGRIVAHGHDGKSPLYRIGDAIDLLAAETNKAAS